MNPRLRVLVPKRLMGLIRFKPVMGETRRPFCSTKDNPTNDNDKNKSQSRLTQYDETYRQLDNLDFMTAAKIVFSESPRKRKFGIDFHLVQLFFALMPSFAVYLVAQYARYEMRKMEAELEQKKKKEEEERAIELALIADEEKEVGSVPELSEVRTRLDKLEEVVKEIAESSKKHSSGVAVKKDVISDKKQLDEIELSSRESSSDSEKSNNKDALIAGTSKEEKGREKETKSSSPPR